MSPIYLILIIISILLLSFRNDKKNIFQFLGVVFIFLIFVVGAIRDASIGTDVELNGDGYHLFWKTPLHYYRDVEPGFKYLTVFIKTLFPSYYAYYSIIYIITVFFFCAFARRMKVSVAGFIAIIFLAGYLHICFNIIRQMLGISLALYIYSIYYSRTFDIHKCKIRTQYVKNTIIFELLVLILAFTVHGSILILIIVPLFDIEAICRFLNKDIVLYTLLGLSIFISVVGHDYIMMVLTVFDGNVGERANMYISDYIANYESFEASHGYITSLVNGLIAILISKGRRNKFFFIGFWGIILTEIASSGMGTLGRTFTNLQYFIFLFYCQIWYGPLSNKTVLNNLKMLTLKTLRISFWLSSLYYTLLINESVNPYKTFLF